MLMSSIQFFLYSVVRKSITCVSLFWIGAMCWFSKHKSFFLLSLQNLLCFTLNFFINKNVGNSQPAEINITPVYLVLKQYHLVLFLIQPVHQFILCYFGLKSFIICPLIWPSVCDHLWWRGKVGWPSLGVWISAKPSKELLITYDFIKTIKFILCGILSRI